MNREQFDKMIEGLVNPSRIKVAVNKDYDFLMSSENKNNLMGWFKTNAEKLEENLRKMKLEWAYAIETCPKDKPFIYMLISPTMTSNKANELTDIAQRTLPEGRTMFVSSGPLRAFNIKQYDNTPTTLSDLFEQYAETMFEVSEV